jgi:hypothetical protein
MLDSIDYADTFDSATYSPEDNKLRLYQSNPDERLDSELFELLKSAGFKRAPKQMLWVAPAWTPDREDFCLQFVDTIDADQTTLVERAQAKAERLDAIAERREALSNTYAETARQIGRRFESGQPILRGHHSQRKAERDKEAMDSAMQRAVAARDSIQYWNWRAEGVERRANYAANPRLKQNRIKKLLADLRGAQRSLTHREKCIDFWTVVSDKVEAAKTVDSAVDIVSSAVGGRIDSGDVGGWNEWCLRDGDKPEPAEFAAMMLGRWQDYSTASIYRWIEHYLNRIAYEQSGLAGVTRYDGELRAAILTTFARAHGAHKPKAAETLPGTWQIESDYLLPVHLTGGCEQKTLEMPAETWRDLMQSIGYHVDTTPPRRTAKTQLPLINPTREDAERLQALWNRRSAEKKPNGEFPQVRECTQAQYSARSKGDYGAFGTRVLDARGATLYRPKPGEGVCRIRVTDFHSLMRPDSMLHLTDKPAKPLPLDWDSLEQSTTAA